MRPCQTEDDLQGWSMLRHCAAQIVLQAVSGETSALVCFADSVIDRPAPRSDEPFCVTGLTPDGSSLRLVLHANVQVGRQSPRAFPEVRQDCIGNPSHNLHSQFLR